MLNIYFLKIIISHSKYGKVATYFMTEEKSNYKMKSL